MFANLYRLFLGATHGQSNGEQSHPTRARDQAAVAQDGERIVAHFQPDKIILFGSYAYGKPHADSDVDLLVIMESDDSPTQRAMRVVPVARVAGVPMDVLVRTPAEIAYRLAIGDHFIKEILTKGRVWDQRPRDTGSLTTRRVSDECPTGARMG